MKYFIDFEAAQFSNEIIEIGCINEKGEEFHSYVNATKKLTSFIKELTHIDQETISNAPISDKVFSDFYQWVYQNDSPAEFYCYGNGDIDFLKKNLKITNNLEAQMILCLMSMTLIDFSKNVREHFGLIKAVSLIKVFNYYSKSNEIQQHNALADAKYLKAIYDYIKDDEDKESAETAFMEYRNVADASDKKEITKIKKRKLTPVEKKIEETDLGKKLYAQKAIDFADPIMIYDKKGVLLNTFANMKEAAEWQYNTTPSYQTTTYSKVASKIRLAILTDKLYANLKWTLERKETINV